MTLQETLTAYRLRAGYSQQKVATCLGITRQAYNHYELGRRKPSYEILAKLAALYGVRTSTLLGEEDAPTDAPRTVTDDDIKFALFGGDAAQITDEMYDEVRQFAAYIKEKHKKE